MCPRKERVCRRDISFKALKGNRTTRNAPTKVRRIHFNKSKLLRACAKVDEGEMAKPVESVQITSCARDERECKIVIYLLLVDVSAAKEEVKRLWTCLEKTNNNEKLACITQFTIEFIRDYAMALMEHSLAHPPTQYVSTCFVMIASLPSLVCGYQACWITISIQFHDIPPLTRDDDDGSGEK